MEEETKRVSEEEQRATKEAWQDVGRQFQVLGESIAQAFRTAWKDDENRRQAQEMRSGLEAMVNEVGRAIQDTANSPEGQQVRAAAERTADHLVEAGEKTVQEVRPHLMHALKQVNEELRRFIENMDQEKSGEPGRNEPPAGTA